MDMKFQMLALGARFEFEGKVYVKTGPLTALSEAALTHARQRD